MAPEILIGTSGWHYPHWRGNFYPPKLAMANWLDFYAKSFSTVELNSTFYRLPSADTIDRWVNSVPENFRFAVKASRFITHRKKLLDPQPALARLLPLLQRFGTRLGPLLFQLPPGWKANPERLAAFLETLPDGFSYAFELRDPSWHCAEIYALLDKHHAAFCIYDIGGFCAPLIVTGSRIYIRLHGPDAPYCGCYSTRVLNSWAAWIREQRNIRKIFVYFDNDEAGYAVRNALELKTMLLQQD